MKEEISFEKFIKNVTRERAACTIEFDWMEIALKRGYRIIENWSFGSAHPYWLISRMDWRAPKHLGPKVIEGWKNVNLIREWEFAIFTTNSKGLARHSQQVKEYEPPDFNHSYYAQFEVALPDNAIEIALEDPGRIHAMLGINKGARFQPRAKIEKLEKLRIKLMKLGFILSIFDADSVYAVLSNGLLPSMCINAKIIADAQEGMIDGPRPLIMQ